jgi:hypothetical protein
MKSNRWAPWILIIAAAVLGGISTAAAKSGEPISAALLLGAITALYLLPWIVAEERHVVRVGPIAVIDIFLGWTFIGWVIALAMAVGFSPRERS